MLHLRERVFYPQDFQSEQSLLPNPSAFETHTLDFCRVWWQGKRTFSLFTSGSTGTPKKIEHTREQLIASAHATLSFLGLTANHTALVCLPTQYIGGRMMLVRGFESGMPLWILPPENNPLGHALERGWAVGFTALVPLQMERFLQATPHLVSKLADTQAIILGGAPISASLEERLQKVPCPMYSTYGMTETVSHVALRRLNGPERSEAYTLLPEIEAETDDRECLRLRGAVTQDTWIQTNDRIVWTGPRSFRWLGRADHVINSGGIKIQLEEIERRIAETWRKPERFFLWGMPHEQLGETLVCMVEGSPWPASDTTQLLQEWKEQLPTYQAPHRIMFVPTFKETPTGKISRAVTFDQLIG